MFRDELSLVAVVVNVGGHEPTITPHVVNTFIVRSHVEILAGKKRQSILYPSRN